MNKRLLLLFLSCIAISNASAQISGAMASSRGEPLPGAVAVSIHLPDSAIATTATTDAGGVYFFEKMGYGTYFIKAVLFGYEEAFTAAFMFDSDSVVIPVLTLTERLTELNEVSVSGAIPRLEQKSDRLVVNVDGMNTTGDNALEVLKKAPGVRLDKDDNIVLRGNGGVTVMLNGKLTYMTGPELSNYLRTLPAGGISKIELIANPPASYDAEGTAGIINIITKRNCTQGYNGTATVDAGYGRYGKVSGSFNLNYNTGRLMVYARLRYGYSESYNKLTLERQIDGVRYDQLNYWHPYTHTAGYTIGGDYLISRKSTLGFMIKRYKAATDALRESSSESTGQGNEEMERVTGIGWQHTLNSAYSASLNYTLQLDSNRRKLSFDADYLNNATDDNQDYTNAWFETGMGDAVTNLRSSNPVSYTIRCLKGDYTHTLSGSWFAEAGFKCSWIATDNNARFDSLKDETWSQDLRRSGHFNYSEQINAVYLTLNSVIAGNWNVKASLRTEQTNSIARSVTLDEVTRRSYLQHFPGIFVTYNVNQDHHLHASFTRRISRQNYTSLNPFIKYTDPYTAYAGNPLLRPSLSGSFLIGYTYKHFQVLSLSYLKVQDAMSRIIYQDDVTKESISRYENLGTTGSFVASSAGSFNIKKWWMVTADVNVSYDYVSTVVQGTNYDNGRLAWVGSADQSFLLPEHIKLSLAVQYVSASVAGLERALPASQVDVGISKALFNKKATISLKARDIFFGNRYRSVLRYNNVNTTWNNEYESRRISVIFSYNFGESGLRTAKDRTTSAGSEESRI